MSKEPYVWDKNKVHTVIWAVVAVLVLVGTFTVELMSDIIQDKQKLEHDLNATIDKYNTLKHKQPPKKEYLPQTCLERIPAFEVIG